MTRIDWTRDFELEGDERSAALSEAAGALASWGLTMPSSEPLVIHFGLNDFYRIGEIEYWIVNDQLNNYCGKFLFLFSTVLRSCSCSCYLLTCCMGACTGC